MQTLSKTIFVAALAVLLPSGLALADETIERIQDLNWLIGDWAITFTEQTSDGSRYRDHGARTCEYALKRTMIRCETFLERLDAEGSYDPPPLTRSSLYYITYDSGQEKYMQIFMSAGREPSIDHWDYDRDARVFSLARPYTHSTRNIEMNIVIRLYPVSDDEVVATETLVGIDDPYNETFTLTARRVN